MYLVFLTKKNMDFVTLLKRWTELEPDRCSMVGAMYAIRGWAVSFDFDDRNRLSQAEIQCAVQEAIEERGWSWSISNTSSRGEILYTARITCYSADHKAPVAYEVQAATHSAALILLQAYLNTLVDKTELVEA